MQHVLHLSHYHMHICLCDVMGAVRPPQIVSEFLPRLGKLAKDISWARRASFHAIVLDRIFPAGACGIF